MDVSPRRAQKKSPACPTGNRQRMITGRPSWSRPATFCTSVAEYWLTQIAHSFRPVSLRCIPRVSTGGVAGGLRTPLAVVVLADPDQLSPSERDLAVLRVVAGGEPARGRAVGGEKALVGASRSRPFRRERSRKRLSGR